MAGKIMKGAPQLNWREVPKQDAGEGHLTGHTLERELMELARRHPQEAVDQIMAAMKLSHLDECGSSSEDYGQTKSFAARAFWFDMVGHLEAGAKHFDAEAHFNERAAEALSLVAQQNLSPSKVAAREAIARAKGHQ